MRTKKVIINFLTDAFPQIIIMALGFFKIKLFLNYLGEDLLGLYQLYGQIVSYLVLVEGGVGSAMLFRLYKPIHDKNKKKVNEIMAASRVVFTTIGTIIIIIGVIISFNISFLIKDNSFSNNYLILTFIIFLLSQSLNYFTLPYRNMFDANQDRYVPNLIYQGVTMLKSIIEIILVIVGGNFMEILISLLVCNIIANVLLFVIFKIKYSDISFKGKKDFSMVSDVKHLFVNTLGGLISNNIDVLLISKYLGLKVVIIYTTYNYFVEAIKQFVDKITGATISGIGDMLAANEGDKVGVFNEYNNIVFFLAMVISTPLFICINGFIDIFYEGRIETSMSVAIAFSLILFMYTIKLNTVLYVTASGLYKETKFCAITDTITNLILSLTLVHIVGMSGVLFATAFSVFISEYILKTIVVHKHVFNRSSKWYFINNFKFFVIFILDLIGGYYLINMFTIKHLGEWFGFFFAFTIINAGLIFIIFKIFNETKFIGRFKQLKRGA